MAHNIPHPEMVLIPQGKYLMGSPNVEERWEAYDGREDPQHEVKIGQPFALGKYPVTVSEFSVFVADAKYDMGKSARIWDGKEWKDTPGKGWHDPGFTQNGDHPVCCVSWEDAQMYIKWLNKMLGLGEGQETYRLPSEAEWEFACRAGTTTPFSVGATISTEQANFDGSRTYGGGRKGEFRRKTTPVGSFPANALGLHDMHGNACEWCQDVWHVNYEGAPTDGSAWTSGGDSSQRVLRGGSWSYAPRGVRSANRSKYNLSARKGKYGFRLARTVLPSATKSRG